MSRERDRSLLEIYDLGSKSTRLVKRFDELIEAPNWSGDGRFLYYNRRGKIERIALDSLETQAIPTGDAQNCNNDHVLSLSGDAIAVSSGSAEDPSSRIYVVPFDGQSAHLVTPKAPSYLHGWSPDGSTLAYCAERDGEFDIYTIPLTGGDETRLTDNPGLNDGPEYSPCGATSGSIR